MDSINQLLVPCETGVQAIESLLTYRRHQDPRFSHRYFHKKLGVQSSGYLCDVIKGRRKLAKKHWSLLAEAIGLDELGCDCFLALLELDGTSIPDKQRDLRKRIKVLKKTIVMPFYSFSGSSEDMYFASHVYAAFSIFNNKPSHRELLRYFGRDSIVRLDKALKHLINMGLICRQGEGFCVAEHLQSQQIELKTEEVEKRELTLEQRKNIQITALEDAKKCCAKWFGNKSVSNFNVAIVSVNRQRFEEQVKAFRDQIAKMVCEMETEDSDMLVKLVAQISPA